MGKTGKWLRNFLTGKKEKGKESKNGSNPQVSACNGEEHHHPTTPVSIPQPTTPKEKRRWSFRRSSAAAPGRPDSSSVESMRTPSHVYMENDDSKKHALAVAAATAAAADAAVAAAKAARAVIQLTAAAASGKASDVEEAAATKIQSVFRAYLARKALNALKGLVKLQALVRGHLVRKQATATLRCMQALMKVQIQARAQRLQMAEETKLIAQRQFVPRKSTHENKFRNLNQDSEKGIEENIKIVEMDLGGYKPVTKARNSYSNLTQTQHRISTQIKQEYHQISPSPSAITDISPRTYSNHFDNYSFASPQCYSSKSNPNPARIPFAHPRSEYAESESLYSFYPGYMANTESSRAKVRSHSAPNNDLLRRLRGKRVGGDLLWKAGMFLRLSECNDHRRSWGPLPRAISIHGPLNLIDPRFHLRIVSVDPLDLFSLTPTTADLYWDLICKELGTNFLVVE